MSITVTLGDGDQKQTFEILLPPVIRAREWRAKLKTEFDPIMSAIAVGMKVNIRDLTSASSVHDVLDIVKNIVPILIESPDTIFNLLLEYSPKLAAEREWIENNATDDQIFVAFQEVMKQAYPLGRLMNFRGDKKPSTSSNSALRAGASRKNR